MFRIRFSPTYFRNFIFGVEDSLVSTVGLLSGIAAAELSVKTIILSGIILILVEAVSMAAGSFLSEYSALGLETRAETPSRGNFISGGIMFLSYFLSGFIPLFPYLIFPVSIAFNYSIFFSLGVLFLLGIMAARISGTSMLRNALRMTCVGGIAIGVGVIAGNIISGI